MTRQRFFANAFTAIGLVPALLLLTQVAGHSYVSAGRWGSGDIPVHMHLGSLGSAWRNAAIDGLRAWNNAGSRFSFSWSSTSRAAVRCERSDSTNAVIWSDEQCRAGSWRDWDSSVLATTHYWTLSSSGTIVDADVIFNSTKRWSTYNGRLRRSGGDTVWDFRRVATHEFGHVLGLDHPDDHGQARTALMNSETSDIDRLQPDDVNGVRAIYGSDPGRGSPDLVVRALRVSDSTLTTGEVFTLTATVANEGTRTSAATRLRYYHWRSSTREWVVVGHDDVSSLSPSASAAELVRLRAPSTAGTYYYNACVQAVAGETNRRNCARSFARVTVSARDRGAPDLVVRNARVSHGRRAAGESFRLSADVHNVGTGGSESTRLQYWHRPPGGDWERVGDNDYVPALGPGRHVALSTPLTASLPEGQHEYTACVVRVRGEPEGSNCSRPFLSVTVGGSDAEYQVTINQVRFEGVTTVHEGEELLRYTARVQATNTGSRHWRGYTQRPATTSIFPLFLTLRLVDRGGNTVTPGWSWNNMGPTPWWAGAQRWGTVYAQIPRRLGSRPVAFEIVPYWNEREPVECIGCEERHLLDAGSE